MDPVYLKVIGVTLLLTIPITPIQPTCLLGGHIPTTNPTDLQNLGLQKKMNIHVQLIFITKVINQSSSKGQLISKGLFGVLNFSKK